MPLYEKKPLRGIQKEYKRNMGYYRHLHPFLELCFVLEGQVVCTVNDEEVIAKEGDALVIFPYQIHEYPYHKNRDGKFALLNIPADVYKPYHTFIAEHRPITPLLPGFVSHDEIKAMLEIIIAAHASGLTYQMCLGFTVGILGAVFLNAEMESKTAKQDGQLIALLEYCGNHFDEKLTLSALAKEFYVNQSALSRLFNRNLGVSFSDFINLLRVEEAGQLLLTTTLSITEIAYQVGFANVRSLNRAFVKHRGLTPGEIRKAAQSQKPTCL